MSKNLPDTNLIIRFLVNDDVQKVKKTEKNISYVDSYLLAVANLGNITLYSYDDKFKSIRSVTVKEP